MNIQPRLLIAILIFCLCASFTPAKKYVKRGKLALEKGDIKKAKEYFYKALDKDSLDFAAHFGLGFVYSEVLEDYALALPHLKKAYEHRPQDSLYDLYYALAKSYHHNEEFVKAMEFYQRLENCEDLDGETNFKQDLAKKREDCRYAMEHKADPVDKNVLVVNAGRTLNTDMPEYVPVLTSSDEIIFTSKRPDDEKEPVNFMDGKYYESMYIARVTPGGFTNLRRYTIPDQLKTSKFFRKHEAVVSLSQDGSKLLTYKEGAIYLVDMAGRASETPKKLVIAGDKDSYQNHAFLNRDNTVLYFTSDMKGGYGGNDIYRSVKNERGEWSKPENLGEVVNTPFDEDSPFLSYDGKSLYFSSEGHPGFGNHDIYRSAIADGKFEKPVNLGAPYNSPAHDIFLVLDSLSANAYFSSGRNGGFGDMDIYRIVDLAKFDRSCPTQTTSALTLELNDADTTDTRNLVVADLRRGYKILEYEWKVNNTAAAGSPTALSQPFNTPGTYTVHSKFMVICDTCLAPEMLCAEIINEVREGKGRDSDDPLASGSGTVPGGKDKDTGGTSGLAGTEMTHEELVKEGFDDSPLLFGFDKATLSANAQAILKNNVSILKKHPEFNIELYGHTDSRGDERYNMLLSKRRANAVRNFLIRHGIEKSRVVLVEGRGSRELLNNCGKGQRCSEKLHKLNRRVVVIVKNDVKD